MPTVYYGTVRPYEQTRDASGQPSGIPRPMLRVRLIGHRRGPEFLALIDSGADLSLFPTEAAHAAGIDLTQCHPGRLGGVGGTINVHVCRVRLGIEGREIEIDADFTADPAQR